LVAVGFVVVALGGTVQAFVAMTALSARPPRIELLNRVVRGV
jgi:hypothetical protein